ncbi:MAG TPA: response regulator transcription factor [Polyangiaceae bacterium]|jgi:two-component system KDP operon response regulator KdpE|nr:response regulator transcription factor [Polyangiaceae bacterium]
MSEQAAILVIEDEPHMRMLLQVTLKGQGYDCIHAASGLEGVAQAEKCAPRVVLLDLGLPDLDGVEVTSRIRRKSTVPIIVLSARGGDDHKISALDAGANDYVTKPFSTGELLARIRVAMRGNHPKEEEIETGTAQVGELAVDFDMRRVTVAGREVRLTPTEYRLLGLMIRSAGRVLTHQQILKEVWGPGYTSQLHYLRIYMKKLRYKIEAEPAQPRYLINEPGVGYRLRLPS